MPALVAGIHAFSVLLAKQDEDGRDKPGHDDFGALRKLEGRRRYFHSILVIS